MSFFRKLAQAAVPTLITIAMPEAGINVAAGMGIKHATPINNQAIPFLNLAVSTLVCYGRHVAAGEDWGAAVMPALSEGGLLMAVSTGLHQSLKVPTQGMIQIKGNSL